MKIFLAINILIFSNYCYGKNLYKYDDILINYSFFKKEYIFSYVIKDEDYLKLPDEDIEGYAEYISKDLRIIGFKNEITINRKKFKIKNLPGMGKYKTNDIEWRLPRIYKEKKSICIQSTLENPEYYYQKFSKQIIFVENISNPKPYYFKGFYLSCSSLRKIDKYFYFPVFKLYGTKQEFDAESVKIEYRRISKNFPIKFKFEGKFPNTNDRSKFELTKEEKF